MEGVNTAICEQDDDSGRIRILILKELPSLLDCQCNVCAPIHARLAQAGQTSQVLYTRNNCLQICMSELLITCVFDRDSHHLIELSFQLIQWHVLGRNLDPHIIAELHHCHLHVHIWIMHK